MLVSSFGCSYETADIEFENTLSRAMEKGNNLAHHLTLMSVFSTYTEECICRMARESNLAYKKIDWTHPNNQTWVIFGHQSDIEKLNDPTYRYTKQSFPLTPLKIYQLFDSSN